MSAVAAAPTTTLRLRPLAPQIGVDLRLVIFGYSRNVRYPEAPPVPPTVLINPVIEVLDGSRTEGWEGC